MISPNEPAHAEEADLIVERVGGRLAVSAGSARYPRPEPGGPAHRRRRGAEPVEAS